MKLINFQTGDRGDKAHLSSTVIQTIRNLSLSLSPGVGTFKRLVNRR